MCTGDVRVNARRCVRCRLCHSEFNHCLSSFTFSRKIADMQVHENPFRGSRIVTDKETDFRQMLPKRETEGQENKPRGLNISMLEGTGERERDRWKMKFLVSCRRYVCIVERTVFVNDTRRQLQAKWL